MRVGARDDTGISAADHASQCLPPSINARFRAGSFLFDRGPVRSQTAGLRPFDNRSLLAPVSSCYDAYKAPSAPAGAVLLFGIAGKSLSRLPPSKNPLTHYLIVCILYVLISFDGAPSVRFRRSCSVRRPLQSINRRRRGAASRQARRPSDATTARSGAALFSLGLRRARNSLKKLNSCTEVASPGVPFPSPGVPLLPPEFLFFPRGFHFLPLGLPRLPGEPGRARVCERDKVAASGA